MTQSEHESNQVDLPKEKKPYPWYVVCFLSNEFCERFAYYGMRAILVIYLGSLGFDEDSCTAIYHAFVVGAYAWPLLGASLADGYFGRYKVILWFSLIYVLGMGLQAFSSLPFLSPADQTFKTTNAIICICALLLIGLGTGGIKPCVSTLGGDQFEDDDEDGREFFFNMFYLSINVGSLISEFLTPKIRGISCGEVLGYKDSCYFIAFLIPAVLMGVALLVFIAGTKWYVIKPPSGDNIFKLHLQTIHYALWSKGTGEEEHWLERAKGKVPDWVIRDMKYFMPMLYVLIPQPIFWCCYDQSGSRWVLQAKKMDGWIGDSVLVLPDQIVILNGAMILIFVPLFSWIYGKIDQCLGYKFCTDLRKWGAGYFLLGVAFVIAAVLQLNIEKDITVFPAYNSEISLRVLNIDNSAINGHFETTNDENPDKDWDLRLEENFNLQPGEVTRILEFDEENEEVTEFQTNEILIKTFKDNSTFSFNYGNNKRANFDITEGRVNWNMVLFPGDIEPLTYPGWTEKNENGKNFMTIVNGADEDLVIDLKCSEVSEDKSNGKCQEVLNVTLSAFSVKSYNDPGASGDNLILLIKGYYDVIVYRNGYDPTSQGEKIVSEFYVTSGASYTLAVWEDLSNSEIQHSMTTDIEPNTVPIGWIIPQYAVLTMAEVLFVTTGYIFCYEQTPPSLKSVVQAYLLAGCAVGNIFVIIVAESKLFPTQTIEFLFFAGLLVVGTIINIILAYGYDVVDNSLFSDFEYPSDMKTVEGVDNEAAEEK